MMVFDNRLLRRMFGPKRNEIVGDWRKLHIEKFCNLCYSAYIFRLMKSMRMTWAGHLARMGEKRNAGRFR
jgi:hypothetical protein